jgi:peptidase E
MRGTALIYSSHNRGDLIHNDLIVQRALAGKDNKRILFLPMSETVQNNSEMERQEFSWGTFRWYFDFYQKFGLEYFPFYWTSGLRKSDVDLLWHHLWTSEVVVLGGGHSRTGMRRYRELGARFDGDGEKFGRLLRERQDRGLLTVGYSAGADQLCEYVLSAAFRPMEDPRGFGLASNTMVTLHHEASRNEDLFEMARRFPRCAVFGLPNDSGIYVDEGWLPSGNRWQVIDFVIDNTWSVPSEAYHVKTRFGARIEHIYPDGRHWRFNGGDRMVRVMSPDGNFNEAWCVLGGQMFHYWTQRPSRYHSTAHILSEH